MCSDKINAWDCACGNGQVAQKLSFYFNNVFATDVSQNQIANSITRENIYYSVSASEKTTFNDSFFDLVCVAQAIHWFDFNLFRDEVKRVLKPGGVFAFWGYSWPSISENIDKEIKEGVLDIIEPFWAEQNKLLWDHYKDIDFPFEKIDTPDFKMIVNWDLNEFYSYMFTWSATRRCIENQSRIFLEDSYKRMKELWGDENNIKQVEMDFCFVAGRNT